MVKLNSIGALRPRTVAEAIAYRGETGAVPFAGGTDLMVKYAVRNDCPSALEGPVLFLDGIDEIRGVWLDGSHLVIGSGTPLARIAGEEMHPVSDADDLEAPIPSILRDAVREIAAPGLRNRATIGGNIVNASPAADTLPPLYILDATVELTSSGGRRVVPLADFITGPGSTALEADEILTAIRLPRWETTYSRWRKVGTRRANALSKLSVAAVCDFREGRIGDFALALGAVAPTVVRSEKGENRVNGRSAGEIDPESVIEAYEPLVRPIDDQRSTATYRKTVAANLITETLSRIQRLLEETS